MQLTVILMIYQGRRRLEDVTEINLDNTGIENGKIIMVDGDR